MSTSIVLSDLKRQLSDKRCAAMKIIDQAYDLDLSTDFETCEYDSELLESLNKEFSRLDQECARIAKEISRMETVSTQEGITYR